MPKLSIIIPCYYNELNIPCTKQELLANEKKFPEDVSFEYVFIDDGSGDGTFRELEIFHREYPHKVKVLKFSRNFGADNASYAGIQYATGDCCAILAADLQDPPEIIVKMYDYWKKGFKLVVANREAREDSFLEKAFSNIYHFLLKKLALPNSPKGGFNLWLFDKQLKNNIIELNEANTFMPNLFMWLGYDYVNIPYKRRKREIGKSKWTFRKKIKSFIDSFVGFSYFPIRFISFSGIIFGMLAVIYAIWLIIAAINNHVDVEGWSTLMVVILFIGSFTMIGIGILGEYVWRNLDASRNRPNFIIDEVLSSPEKNNEDN